MTQQLNQIVAVEKGARADAARQLTDAHQNLQRLNLLSGISRTYQPRDDEGEVLPPERQLVQLRADEALASAANALAKWFDIAATKDWGNCIARADVVVDGQTLLENVPATFLLFLERQLADIRTFVAKLPVLDSGDHWGQDPQSGLWQTQPVQTVRTKKVPRNHVKAEATERHPAQVEVYYEDVPVGTWTTVKTSGALPPVRVRELLSRVTALQEAVKTARERANMTDVLPQRVGVPLFRYLFG